MKRRIERLQASLKVESLSAYLITEKYNLRYMSGFTGTNGLALVTASHAYFLTDFRYTQQASKQCEGYEVILAGGSASTSSPLHILQDIIEKEVLTRIGYEEQHMTVAEYDGYENFLKAELVPASGMIEVLRSYKDADEIAKIKQACAITDKAFDYLLTYLKPGLTEIEVANTLDFKMREYGASGLSFDTIVASGKRSAMPHGVASEKRLEKGDIITIDYGCYYQGYASDMTRTVALGDVDPRLKEIHQIVYEANQLVRDLAKPGMTGQEIDAIARNYIDSHGYGKYFGHALGHSYGLEVHEDPNATPSAHTPFEVNQLVTDEPGIYIEGLGGARIEDDLLFIEDGNVCLTQSPRELILL